TTVREKLSRRDLALASRIEHLAATREKMVRVMDHAIVERDSAGWRRDFDFYRNDLAPTLESLKWVLQTLSDSSNQDITRVIADTTRYGMALKERTLVSVAVLLAVGLLLAGWIHRWVGVFNRQIGGAVVSLDRLAARMRRETEGQALEARNQVEEISGVYTNLHDLEASLTRIREQTEKMALQTDSASLECVQGMEVLAYSQDRMAAILQQVRDISQAMELTKSQTGRMDGILAILNELVDQTKLLSFNATIEAAGAGESGARFAVVAKQVRHLANRAREATQDIHEMIRRVQRNAEETRAATERGTAAVNEGENLMQVVTERLDLIVGSVSEVSDLAGGVFLATQAQTKSLSRVNRFVGEAKATAERVDRNSRGTLGTAEELATTAQGLSLLLGRRRELDMESPSTDPATPATPEAPEGGAGVPPDPGPES
ncbi:MAG: methyl-accepting chemotaxis protein, partial [Nitrospirota bacterium]|nr:methyl-accepting chemotaxis protein [Nitrospirota bacterium]